MLEIEDKIEDILHSDSNHNNNNKNKLTWTQFPWILQYNKETKPKKLWGRRRSWDTN
jgi:hypothetical protein